MFFKGAIWLLLLGLGLALPAQAQPNSIPFRRISLEQGLSQSTVFAIAQDRHGFLWLGTQDGLNRYDGYRFTVYQHDASDSTSLSASWISALEVGHDGTLWVGTHGSGLNRFDPQTGRFTRYRHQPGEAASLGHDIVSDVLEDEAGRLWVGTYGGLSRLDPQTETFTTYRPTPEEPNSLSHERALVLAEANGALWVGTDGGGLNRLDPQTGRFSVYRAGPGRLSHNVVLALHAGRDGTLWIGTANGGLDRLDPATGRFTHFRHDPADPNSLSHNRVLSIQEDEEGFVWVGTDGGGLNRLDPATGRVTRLQHNPADTRSLSSDVVTALFEARDGSLWAGTGGGGLNQASRFLWYQHRAGDPGSLSNAPVLAIYESGDGTLWAGTDGGGLDRLDPATRRFDHFRHDPGNPASLSQDRVLDVMEDHAGRLWIATGNGLDRFDAATGRFDHYRHDPADPASLSSDRVFFVHESPRAPGVLWLGTWGGGLNRFDVEAGTFTALVSRPDDPNTLSNNRVISIGEAHDGTLWVGTFGGGLNRLDPATGRVTRFQHDPADPASLSQDIVASIYEARDGTLWVGTGEGLNRFEPETETFTRYTRHDGLPNNTIYGILEDEAGRLWLSTNRGLSAFDPEAETFVNYDLGDGLQSNEFSQGAYFKSASGELFFGGVGGLNRFDPADVRDTEPPPVVLTTLRPDDGPAVPLTLAGREAVMLPKGTPFSFEFAVLDFANPSANRYAYRLEGLEDTWHVREADRRFAAYSNLPGGTYTFRVRGADADGIWNDEGAAVRLTIVPPFWDTWWFRLLASAAVLGLLGTLAYTWHRVRLRRVERMRDERAEIQRQLTESREAERLHLAQELHDGAVQDLYGVRFNLEALSGNLPDGDAAPLEQGKASVQEVIRQLRVICGDLRPPALAPFGLERAIRSHAEAFDEQHPDLEVHLDLTPDGQTLPDATRLALYRVYQEAMNNIAKHAEARHIHVRFDLNDEQIVLEIRDNGKGFTPPARWLDLGRRRHYGLLGIAERVDALDGRLEVDSAPGRGTTVRVVLEGYFGGGRREGRGGIG